MDAFLITVCVMAVFSIIRSEMVFSARMRAIDIIHKSNLSAIRAGLATRRYDDFISRSWLGEGGYLTQMLDLRKWALSDFYPELEAQQ